MKVHLALLSLTILLACTSPNIEGEVKSFSDSVTAVSAEIEKNLISEAKIERDSSLDLAIKNKKIVYTVSPQCSPLLLRSANVSLEECKLVETFQIDKSGGTAKRALIQVRQLSGYTNALSELSKSKSSTDISNSLALVIDQLSGLSKEIDKKGIVEFAAKLQGESDDVKKVTKFLVERYRYRALRKTVNLADSAVAQTADSIIAYFDTQPATSTSKEYKALTDAEAQARKNRKNASTQNYKHSITNLEKAYTAYQAKEKASPAYKIQLIKSTHSQLAKRLASPKDAEEIIALLEKLKELSESF